VEDVEFLKERALQFLEMSKNAKIYELALFHAEQALQLYTKYLIYKLGDFPQDALPPGSPRQSARALRRRLQLRRLPQTPFCRIGAIGTRIYNLLLPPL